jgi:hypothetical protein
MHEVLSIAPTAVPYVPAGHSWQVDAPLDGQKRPALHSWHVPAH